MPKIVKQVVVNPQATQKSNQLSEEMSFFTPTGQAILPGVYQVTTATAIGTAAKTTSTPAPPAGAMVGIAFTNGNSAASPTLNFNGAGAVNILLGGTAPAAIEATFAANGWGLFYYDGTSLHQVGVYS